MSNRITIDQTSRNVICSVVFVDLVEYSKKSVAEQLDLKDRFTALLADALKDIALSDRIVLDTGDGAAISFLGDPEDALFVAMCLRDALRANTGAADGAERAPIRVGINLGPVRLVRDINGHPNIVGDGINVAQRIMSFARPGQILASRSYYDVVSCLSDEYARLFSYEGSRTDKHVREHDVYVVGESENALKLARSGLRHRAAGTHPWLTALAPAGEDSRAGAARSRVLLAQLRQSAAVFLRNRTKVAIAGGALGALVAALAVQLALRQPAAPEPRPDPLAVTAVPEPVPEPVRDAKPEPAPGVVKLSIDPWGEVFVNGKSQGVSPPMKAMTLAPGKYKVVVRNSTLRPYMVAIEVKSHKEVTVGHVFN